VADAFDVLTARPSYKESLSREEAMAEISRCAGSQFDAHVVEALLALAGRDALEG